MYNKAKLYSDRLFLQKASENFMRSMEFKMERQGLLRIGDKVTVTEGTLPGYFYYTIDPSLAMSGNYTLRERLRTNEGTVVDIQEKTSGYYVTVNFLEDIN